MSRRDFGEGELTVHLVSSASMGVFTDNTLANFKNLFSEEIILEGDWRVALSEVIFPAFIYNVVDTEVRVYRKKEKLENRTNSEFTVSKPYIGERGSVLKGAYENVEELIQQLNNQLKLEMKAKVNKVTGHVNITFKNKEEGITFPTPQIPSLLGFKGSQDGGTGFHIGFMSKPHLQLTNNLNEHDSDYPFDLSAGIELMFIYLDIIDYQHVGHSKAPLLRIIDTKRRLKNGNIGIVEPSHRIVFSNLDYKKLLTKSIQCVAVQLRSETGNLVPFAGTGKVILTLHFKKFYP